MSDEKVVRNVFDQAEDRRVVPVVIEENGEKKTVGRAVLFQSGEDYIEASFAFKTDAPQDVIDLFSNGITGVSVEGKDIPQQTEPDYEITQEEMYAVNEFQPHAHKPVPHGDSKPPWCDYCGLTTGYLKPLTNFGFNKPADPIHKED